MWYIHVVDGRDAENGNCSKGKYAENGMKTRRNPSFCKIVKYRPQSKIILNQITAST